MAFTYFFRDIATLEMIRDLIIPDLRTRRYINIWSAGCAMGQEPYTIAILLRDSMGPMIYRNVRIYATDLDPERTFCDVVTMGRYPVADLQRVPSDIVSRHFEPDRSRTGYFRVVEEIRRRVQFVRHDLLSFEPVRTGFNLIVCKNVLLHFTPEERVSVLRMFYSALIPGGFLVTEQTQKMPAGLDGWFIPVVQNAQIFQKDMKS